MAPQAEGGSRCRTAGVLDNGCPYEEKRCEKYCVEKYGSRYEGYCGSRYYNFCMCAPKTESSVAGLRATANSMTICRV
ncbi:hypothetical protein [Streptomyces flavidovirens]|uniref:hypothetical protein n=1 Tax=Streptomyces flavidovirens TaxID=67298 RepID=UPI00368C2963